MVLTSASPGTAVTASGRARERLDELFDRGTVRPVATLSGHGIVVARGDVRGTEALAFATEPEPSGGSVGIAGCVRIAEAVATARRGQCPIVGIWPSGGVGLTVGVTGLAGIGPMFAAIRGASGRIPQISVVLGPSASGAAYVPAMTDVVVEIAFGQRIDRGFDIHEPGAPDERVRQSERADVVVKNGSAAVTIARSLVDLLGRPGRLELDRVRDVDLGLWAAGVLGWAFDVRPLVNALLDCPGIELHPQWASKVVTVLGRFGGRTIGVIATEPRRPGDRIDETAVKKGRRFGRLCDAFGLPLMVVNNEENGLGPGFIEEVGPRVRLLTRAVGGAARGSKCSDSSTLTAEFVPRAAEASTVEAADAPGRRQRVAEHRELGRRRVGDNGFVFGAQRTDIDEIVLPMDTRSRIALALAQREVPPARHPVIHCRW